MSTTRGRITRHASWLELFYDLLFVALFSLLARGLTVDPGAATTLKVLGLFAPAWWVWVSYTVSSNLYGEWGKEHRVLTLGTMACLLVMTAGIVSALDGSPGLYAAGFAASRVVLLALVGIWQLRRPGDPPPVASYVCYSVSAVLWLASIPLGAPVGYVLWAVSLTVELVVRLREQVVAQRRHVAIPFDVELLVERFGLLVIVALGEGVVRIAGALSHRHLTAGPVIAGLAGFVILATLWWGYFDFAGGPGATAYDRDLDDHAIYAMTRDVFLFGHFFVVGAVLATSAGIGAVVAAAVADHGFAADLRLLCDALALYVVTGAVLAARLGGDVRRLALVAAGVAVALGLVAIPGDHWSPAAALVAIAAVLLVGRLGPARP
jgi:low temperature requirement protein LtrA